jgi:hypothetical protein
VLGDDFPDGDKVAPTWCSLEVEVGHLVEAMMAWSPFYSSFEFAEASP